LILASALAVSASKSTAHVVSPSSRDTGATARPYLPDQDTSKRGQEKKPAPPSDLDQVISRSFTKSPGSTTPEGAHLRDFRLDQFPQLTLDVVDSLSRLYPELREFLQQQAIIQSALRQDLAETALRKHLAWVLADLHLPGELEGKLRRNHALYGTIDNPMKPPPPPNQVNLFDAITAITNLLRYLGVK
jgi:hypothetical protein